MSTPNLTKGAEAESEIRQSAKNGAEELEQTKKATGTRGDGKIVVTEADDDFSEGDEGIWAWLAVFGGWIIQLTGFGYSQAFGVYQDYYVRVYLTNCSSSQISWIGSTQLFLQLGMGILAGRLFDRGYFYSIIISGCVLSVFSLFMLSLTHPGRYYQVFLAQAIGVGIGSGLANVPSLAVIARHFKRPHRRALAMAIVASGSSTGGTLHPIMLNSLLNNEHHAIGFGGAVRASAGMIAGCLVLACAVIRKEAPRKKSITRALDIEKSRAGLETAAAKASSRTEMPLKEAIKKLATDPPYVLMMIAMFFFSQGFFFPVFYLQLDAIVHNIDSTFAFYSLTILNSASIVGRLTPGFLASRVGLLNMLIIASLACSVVTTGMIGISNDDVAGVAAIGVFFGLFSGAYASLLAPTLAMLADDPSEMGARIGVGFAFHGLGSLIGTPITGALLTEKDLWWRAVVYGGVMCLSAGIAYVLCRSAYKKKRGIISWVV